MTSIYGENILAGVRLIHAEQLNVFRKFHRFMKKQKTQLKTEQLMQGISN